MTNFAVYDFDVVVVGAGFSGLYAFHRLRQLGLTVRVLEAGEDIGGTWYWNAYPGARCDVESVDYSYSFSPELDQEWTWTERYASQPEILAYIHHVADRFDLRSGIAFGARVARATYDEGTTTWLLETERGERYRARFCVFATGSLSAPLPPDLPGLEAFIGPWYMTQQWPREPVDFRGKRVALVGTGSSGIQALPVIAGDAAHVTVFQRTPNFSIPGRNHALSAEDVAAFKAAYPERRAEQWNSHGAAIVDRNPRCAEEMEPDEQRAELERRWERGGALNFSVAFRDVMVEPCSNAVVQEFIRDKVRSTVRDPAVAELLCPTGYPYATKRPCMDHGYFEAFNRGNVTLVSVTDNPLASATPTGLRLADGSTYDADIIVFATGYDALSGALTRIDIRGREGRSLRDAWAEGPVTYLGLAVAGFPNLFTVAAPGSGSILTMVIAVGEQNVDWIADLLLHLREHGIAEIEASDGAQHEWTRAVEQSAAKTLFAHPTASFYRGANVPGKPLRWSIYIGGFPRYRAICDEVAAKGYTGFALREATRRDRGEVSA